MRKLFALCLLLVAMPAAARDYATVDPALTAVSIDADAKEAFACVRAGPGGRLFVGGRDGVFVYEPRRAGGFAPRTLVFRFPEPAWVQDIETLGNDLYILTSSALYLIPDGVRKRADLAPRKLLWGMPLGEDRQGFRSLAWGPEGDLYIAMSDPLGPIGDARRLDHFGYWTFLSPGTPPKRFAYHGVGGVLRCKPDGSGLRVVARGLRAPRGLTFDRQWNLFAIDNGGDKLPDRCLHVTPHSHLGWPRGWTAARSPGRSDLSQPMLELDATTACYYDEPTLPAKYRNALLIARKDRGGITCHPLDESGTKISAVGADLLMTKKRACVLHVAVGCGGRVFAIVTAGEKAGTELVMIMPATDRGVLIDADLTEAKLDTLWNALSDLSWQTRRSAHLELLRRGGESIKLANKRLLTTKASDPALLHLIWLASSSQVGNVNLLAMVEHRDSLIRAQAIRALTEFPDQLREEAVFTKGLIDEDPVVQQAALLAHFSPGVAWSRPLRQAVERGAAISKNTYLRQLATTLLAERCTLQELETMCKRVDAPQRLAGVLAVGAKLTTPPTQRPLAPHLPLRKLAGESAYIIPYADGKVDLRDLGRVGGYTLAEHWKADKHTIEQEFMFKLLRKLLTDEDASVRLQAAHFLWLLNDPRTQAEVARVRER